MTLSKEDRTGKQASRRRDREALRHCCKEFLHIHFSEIVEYAECVEDGTVLLSKINPVEPGEIVQVAGDIFYVARFRQKFIANSDDIRHIDVIDVHCAVVSHPVEQLLRSSIRSFLNRAF